MNKFNLASSMADRINFDNAVRNYLDEANNTEPLVTEAKDVYFEQFINSLEVDDLEEAKARFDDIFTKLSNKID